jgi:hypothetical protein
MASFNPKNHGSDSCKTNACATALRLYCVGLKRRPVSASIAFMDGWLQGYLFNFNGLIIEISNPQIMDAISFYKRYPYSISFYILYLLFTSRLVYNKMRLDAEINIPHAQKLMNGEGLAFGYMLAFIWSIIFVFVAVGHIATKDKAQNKFYGYILALIIFSVVLLVYSLKHQ